MINSKDYLRKERIEQSIRIFYKMYEDFISSKTKLDLDCHEHFQEIRFQLDQHREELKEKIDDIYMKMIDKTKEVESSCLKSLNLNHEDFLKSFDLKSIHEDLDKLEETFRNPHLMTESVKEIQVKQQKAIQTIQSKLNEMNQVKYDLKASNQFKKNVSFNQDLFGQLKLSEYFNSNYSFKSKILKGQQPSELIKLCEFNSNAQFKLLYRASEHGFDINNFHSKCDGHANTLTILKANGSSFIFGGFTSAKWESHKQGQCKSDPNAFLFSLTNKDNKPCKMKINPNQHQYAIYCHSECGPTFGFNDFEIASNSNTNNESISNLGNFYNHPLYAYGTNEAKSFLAGSNHFQLSEIEVYQKE